MSVPQFTVLTEEEAAVLPVVPSSRRSAWDPLIDEATRFPVLVQKTPKQLAALYAAASRRGLRITARTVAAGTIVRAKKVTP